MRKWLLATAVASLVVALVGVGVLTYKSGVAEAQTSPTAATGVTSEKLGF